MSALPDVHAWGPAAFLVSFAMWTGMMGAMMLPSVTPWILALSRRGGARTPMPAGQFLLGYILVWTGYSAAAAALQWTLHERALLSPALRLASPIWGGALLVAAGVFQWTPIKEACLRHCRSPLGFFLIDWTNGRWGALRMGLHHGLFCVGCCWALMALSFVAGIMNLAWMALVTVFVLIDHAWLRGVWLGRAAGILLAIWGLGMMGGG